MRLSDLKIYNKTYNGDTRQFFDINSRYSGYISRDKQTYFVLDNQTNSYKDFSAAELDTFLQNLDNSGITETINNITRTPADFINSLTTTDGGKVTTGLILLGALILGVVLINKKS